jgi:exodeoxyribonuclease V beta subunit
VRQALGRIGIASVSIGQDTVFESEEAEDLAALLAALRPGVGDGALRAALATRSLGWTAGELAGLASDEGAWEQVLADFEGYRAAWGARGFLGALEELLHGREVPARLRRGPDGERRLTNLLHLAELAQAASREHPGPEGLERWLADRRSNPKDGGDAALLRLESDENLVQVVTYHKSKGLEYPVVFLPVPWSSGPKLDPKAPVSFHDRETLTPRLDLGSPQHAAHRDLCVDEDLAERLRLFYVALTRAKQRCVVHWGAVNAAEGSAAAYLLHQGPDRTPAAQRMKDLDEPDLREELEALARLAPSRIRVEDLEYADTELLGEERTEPLNLQAAVFRGRIPDAWRLLSFSLLAGGREAERPDYDGLDTRTEPPPGGLGALEKDTANDAAQTLVAPIDPIFRFPRGIQAGHCLHDLFEHLDFRAAEGPELHRAAETALARHGIEPHWADTLVELAGRVLDTSLTREGLRLRGLGPEDRRNELEFHFALDGFDPAALMTLLRDHGVPAAVGLPSERLAGLMKGFVDLVLRVDGRFYILDYKSNHLGDRLDDYGPDGLARAMAEHHYHLQYLIYTLALHRYLGLRLPGYDYERHMGGSLYLFLRGMRPALGPNRGIYRARPSLGLIQDLDRVFGGQHRRLA